MYIELFILDNIMFDMLILRLGAAICGRRLRILRALLFCAGGSVYAVFAVNSAVLTSLWCKLILCLVMGLGIPCADMREYGSNVIGVIASAFIIGGSAFFMLYAAGGAVDNGAMRAGNPLRLTMFIASAAAAMSSAVRRLRRGRITQGRGILKLIIDGREIMLPAMVDSGNCLYEPVSGLPVAVCRIPDVKGSIPIPAGTIHGRDILYALRPDKADYMGRELDILVAITGEHIMPEAILPAVIGADK